MPIDLKHGFRFGAFTAEPLKGCITGDDMKPRHLPPKAMDVLVRLAEAAPEPVTREELLNAVWGERFVSDEVLTHAVKELRHALGDSSTEPQYVQTIPKRGYQLLKAARAAADPRPAGGRRKPVYLAIVIALVVVLVALGRFALDPPQDGELTEASPKTVDGQVIVSGISVNPTKSLAVLPFVRMSNGPEDEYFADGLSEELRNSLSQLPELRVIGRRSSSFFEGKDYSLSEIAGRLSVAYVVEGSVRRSGDTLRITAQLIRTSDVSQVWSRTYDVEPSDVLAVQTDVAEQIAAALGVLLDDETRERMRAIRIDDVEAFIAYQKGLEAYARAHGPDTDLLEGLANANTYFDTALEAQPDLSAARVLRADWAHHRRQMISMGSREEQYPGEVKHVAEALQADLELAWRASPYGNQRDILNLERTLVSDDWTGLSRLIQTAMRPGSCPRINIAESLSALGFAQELAAKLKESLACNPLDSYVIVTLATAHIWAGRPQEALELIDHAEGAGVIALVGFNYVRRLALTVAGRFAHPDMQSFLRREPLIRDVLEGKLTAARQKAEQYWADPDSSLGGSLYIAALVGDRARANEFAARLDGHPGSAMDFLRAIRWPCMEWAGIAQGCVNGMSFDLDATPNFKARIEESGLPWPPFALRDTSNEY